MSDAWGKEDAMFGGPRPYYNQDKRIAELEQESATLKRDLLDAYAAATEKNKERDALKAEVERLKESSSALIKRWREIAEKAEAELAAAKWKE